MANVQAVKDKVKGMVAPKVEVGTVEKALVSGDLSGLTAEGRIAYYKRVCESVGLNPFTKPFDYIVLNGKLTLYARKDCTQQLCKLHNISTKVVNRENVDGIYIVTVRAEMNGRSSDDDGAVVVEGLKGDKLCNAIMKSVTKAKRRAVLGICGLGFTDEAELDTIEGHQVVPADDMDEEHIVKVEEVEPYPKTHPKEEPTDEELADLEMAEELPTVEEEKEVIGSGAKDARWEEPLSALTIGATRLEICLDVVAVKVYPDAGKRGKTSFCVKDEDGTQYFISRWGVSDPEKYTGHICTFFEVHRSQDYNGKPQYMAKEVKAGA